MTPHARARMIVRLRRVIQVASLALFFFLLLRAQDETVRPGTHFFFDIDPLIMLTTWLASHQLAGLSLLALITAVLTLLLGRVFCGWVCPLGVLHNAVTWLRERRAGFRLRAGAYSGWQRAKYMLLLALLIMALFGANWVGVFDPASLLTRSMGTAVLPALGYAADESSTAIYNADPHVGPLHLTFISEPIYRFTRDWIFFDRRPAFSGSELIFLLFLLSLGLNLLRPRFWCRYVCPTGALLGLISRRASLRIVATDPALCTDCQLCTLACPAGARPAEDGKRLPDECLSCWNCVAACKQGGLDMRFVAPFRRAENTVDLGKRRTITSLMGGLGGLMLFRLSPRAQGLTFNPALIRPPGALPEDEFLARCVQCGLCMQACPTCFIHPTLAEAGLEGLWTPVLIPGPGYCEFECKLCAEVCPTGAIENLPLAEKKKVKMGLAYFDVSRCLPYAFGRECIVCEEHCPVPDKAIYFEMREVLQRDGSSLMLKIPRVDADLCTGCGICEAKCVFADLPAIRITSAGETRHPGNQPILPDASADWSFESE